MQWHRTASRSNCKTTDVPPAPGFHIGRALARDEQGASVVIVVLVVMVLLGFTALAVDGSNLYFQNQRMQVAADAAALAGAHMLARNGTRDAVNAEISQLAFVNGADNVSWSELNNGRAVSVTASRIVPAYFARIYGHDSFTVAGSAAAQFEPVTGVGGLFPVTLDCDCLDEGRTLQVEHQRPTAMSTTTAAASTPTPQPTATPTATPTPSSPTSGSIVLSDGSTFLVSYVGQNGNSWTYEVEEKSGKDLSHWLLNIDTCMSAITGSAPGGAEVGTDGSIGVVGIKWNVSDKFKKGTFTFTLNKNYPAGEVYAYAKADNGNNRVKIRGPICTTPIATPIATATPSPTPTPAPANTPAPETPLACSFDWVDWNNMVSSQSELAQDMDNVARSGLWRLNQVIPDGPEVLYASSVAAELEELRNSGEVATIPLSNANDDGNFVICGFTNVRLLDYDLNAGTLTLQVLDTLIHGVETSAVATDLGVGRDVRLIR